MKIEKPENREIDLRNTSTMWEDEIEKAMQEGVCPICWSKTHQQGECEQ